MYTLISPSCTPYKTERVNKNLMKRILLIKTSLVIYTLYTVHPIPYFAHNIYVVQFTWSLPISHIIWHGLLRIKGLEKSSSNLDILSEREAFAHVKMSLAETRKQFSYHIFPESDFHIYCTNISSGFSDLDFLIKLKRRDAKPELPISDQNTGNYIGHKII